MSRDVEAEKRLGDSYRRGGDFSEMLELRKKGQDAPSMKVHDPVNDETPPQASLLAGDVDLADVGQNGAAVDQILKWSGTAWIVGNDEIGTPGSGDISSPCEKTT